MFKKCQILVVAKVTLLLILCSSSLANEVNNAGFETDEVTHGGWPDSYGDWKGNYSDIVSTTSGITPYQGSYMLRFDGTDHSGSEGSASDCQVYQIIDISAYSSLVATGKAIVNSSAYFNRIDYDSQTDTRFVIQILAMDGLQSTFPARWESQEYDATLDWTNKEIFTDTYVGTWQQCEAQLTLPSSTTFIVIGLYAIENIYNDSSFPEFDGHFADAVTVEIVTGPVTRHVDGVNGSDSNDGLTRETAFATIQKGVDDSNNGDIVLVWPDVYNEAIHIDSKTITLQSADEPAVIQAPNDYAVSIYNVYDSNCIVKNFVLKNSDLGVFLVGGYPAIENLTITDNDEGISAWSGANPTIINCIFWNNSNGDLFQCQADYSYVEEEMISPIAYWKLNSDANDSAGNNDGTIYGATTTDGKVGEALQFNGSSDFISVPSGPTLDFSQSYTISAWLKPTENPTNAMVWFGYHGGAPYGPNNNRSIHLRMYPNGAIRYGLYNDDLNTGSGIVTFGQWNHIVVSYDYGADSSAIYVGGQLILTGSNGPYNGGLRTATIGKWDVGFQSQEHYKGLIDEVAIYDKALSENAVRAIYQTGLAEHPIETGPLFADPNNNDYHLKSKRGRYWPQYDLWALDSVTSPCVDAGDPNSDYSSEAMPNGARINMGAYGGTAYGSMSEWPLDGDLNFDKKIDSNDLSILTQEWLQKLDWAQ